MPYRILEVVPVAGALGAEIGGVDLSAPMDDETFCEIKRAYHENLVIFFRDQNLTPRRHLAFARRFGEIHTHPFASGLDGYPQILPVVKESGDATTNFGGIWHSDLAFQDRPPLGAVLYAHEVPAIGGDTLFANMYRAYDALSDGLKKTLDGLVALHSGARSFGAKDSRELRRQAKGSRSMKVQVSDEAATEVAHPAVRTHPETGRKALYVSAISTRRFKGWSEAESKPLLDYLCAHAVRPEFTCRFRWRAKSLAFWDNRCTQHYALNDYHGHRRVMHRVAIQGDRPA
jgi:taurine dioxygenase